jgi:hypothetical protein
MNNGAQHHSKFGMTFDEFKALTEAMDKGPLQIPGEAMETMIRKLVATVEELDSLLQMDKMRSTNMAAILSATAVMIANTIPIPANAERCSYLVPKGIVKKLDRAGQLHVNDRPKAVEIQFLVPKKIITLANRMPTDDPSH